MCKRLIFSPNLFESCSEKYKKYNSLVSFLVSFFKMAKKETRQLDKIAHNCVEIQHLTFSFSGVLTVVKLNWSVPTEAWNTNIGRMAGRSQESKIFNDYTEEVTQCTRRKHPGLLPLLDMVSPEMLQDAVLGVNTAKSRMLVEVFKDYIKGMVKLIGKETIITI